MAKQIAIGDVIFYHHFSPTKRYFIALYGGTKMLWLLTYLLFFIILLQETGNPYEVPISMGIFKVLESPLDITTSTIIRRIVSNHEAYQVPL